MSHPDIIILLFLIPLLLVQGISIFRNAVKNNIPNPWLWGLFGSIQFPCPLIAYLIYKHFYFKKKGIKNNK